MIDLRNDPLAPLVMPLSRRAFGRRALRWTMAGGIALGAMACGSGVSKEAFEDVRGDVDALQTELRKLKSSPGEQASSPSTAGADGHGASSTTATDAHSAPSAAASDAEVHWSYEGKGGPSEWGSIAPENAVCATGATQSPIDISFTQPSAGGRTVFRWNPTSPLTVVNNGHTIQANVETGSRIEIDGQPYQLVQFHFHAPSEHTLEGKSMAMETHFVHKNDKGDLAVIGVLHALGAENGALAPIWNGLPKGNGAQQGVPSFDLLSVLPRERQMFRYAGSLTTPPCTEGVRWQVMQSPTTVSQQQVAAFLELFKAGNSRPIQPLKARDVLKEAA